MWKGNRKWAKGVLVILISRFIKKDILGRLTLNFDVALSKWWAIWGNPVSAACIPNKDYSS